MSENYFDISIYQGIRSTLTEARAKVYVTINFAMVEAYWEIGRQFHKSFPIRATLWYELSWSHYRLLMKIENEGRREFYGRECAVCT